MTTQPLSALTILLSRHTRRRDFITLLGGAAALPLAAHAQQPRRIPRLCFLTFDPGTLRSTRFEAFFQGLHDLGYVDGQTITIDYLSADGDGERFPALAAECVRLKADVIAVSTTPATQAAKRVTATTPDRHDRTRRPRGNWARRQPCPTRKQRHRDVDDGSRTCDQTSSVTEGGRPRNFAGACALVSRRPDRTVTSEGAARGSSFAGR